MGNRRNLIIIGSVIAIALILQVIYVAVSKVDAPAAAAVDFAKAYFMLDRSMSDWLCSEFSADEKADMVDEYLHQVAEQARAMGFSPSYMRNQLSRIETETLLTNARTAEVRITGNRSRFLNPIYYLIGRLFFLIETHKVDEILTLVKEDGQWKVCGQPFSLAQI